MDKSMKFWCGMVSAVLLLTTADERLPLPVRHLVHQAHHGKPSAPVQVTCDVGAALSQLSLAFSAPATDVVVTLRGIDGLELQDTAAQTSYKSVAAGETLALQAHYAQRSSGFLSVTVSAHFGTQIRSQVAAFQIGTAEQMGKTRDLVSGGQALHRLKGRTVRLLPATSIAR